MTLKKRGLGRGLESLLADTTTLELVPPSSQDIDGLNNQAEIAQTLITHLRRENQQLIEEAENLRNLLEAFEAIVQSTLT